MTDSAHAGGADSLVDLDQDHPGFRDAAYRARRNTIARAALEYGGGPVPEVPYTEEEHAVEPLEEPPPPPQDQKNYI